MLPPGATYRVVSERWRDVDIDVSETRYDLLGTETLVLVAVIPLVPKAISIRLHGPVSGEAEMRADLRRVLASLEGIAGRMPAQPLELLAVTFVTGGVALTLLLAYGIMYLLRWRRDPLLAEVPRTTLLYSIAVLFLISGTCGVVAIPWMGAGTLPLGLFVAVLAVRRSVRLGRKRPRSG